MEELTLNDQIILYDRQATMSAYMAISELGTDICACGGCKNFRQFRSVAYGPSLLALLDRLGVDPLKEWEVYFWGEEIDGLIPYGGWFAFVGEWSPNRTGMECLDPSKEAFSFTDSFPNATKQFGPKVLAVRFTVQIPKAPDYVSDWG
jgi:hypothetical protein